MGGEYRIEIVGNRYFVIDPSDELLGSYSSEEGARENIERFKKQDAMWETANLLLDTAIKAHMEIHGVDRDTSCRTLKKAAELTE